MEAIAKLNDANDILKNVDTKEAYDAKLRAQKRAPMVSAMRPRDPNGSTEQMNAANAAATAKRKANADAWAEANRSWLAPVVLPLPAVALSRV
jgi:hypothetical protein